MCETDKNGKKNKGDEDMLKEFSKQDEKQLSPKNIQVTNRAMKKLAKGKTTIVCKDGIAQIDPSHPDYRFWVED